jgi:hypothetical protein
MLFVILFLVAVARANFDEIAATRELIQLYEAKIELLKQQE